MTTSNLAMVCAGGLRGTFTTDGIMRSARGFHHAAAKLETVHQQQLRRGAQDVTLDQTYIEQVIGGAAGATVLEALALELVLKAHLHRAGVPFPKSREGHDHAALFALVPGADKLKAEHQYQLLRHPAMRLTLVEVLAFSRNVFVEWRYMHEQPSVQASMGEMQRAFAALAKVI